MMLGVMNGTRSPRLRHLSNTVCFFCPYSGNAQGHQRRAQRRGHVGLQSKQKGLPCSDPSYSMPHKERSRFLLLIIALPHLERARVLACLQTAQAMRRSTLPPPVAPRRLRRRSAATTRCDSTPAAAAAAFCAGKPSPLQTSPPLIHRRDDLPFHRRPSCRRVPDGAGADDVQATAGAVGAGGAGVAQRASARVGTGRKSAGSSLSRTQQRILWRFQLHCNSKPRSSVDYCPGCSGSAPQGTPCAHTCSAKYSAMSFR